MITRRIFLGVSAGAIADHGVAVHGHVLEGAEAALPNPDPATVAPVRASPWDVFFSVEVHGAGSAGSSGGTQHHLVRKV